METELQEIRTAVAQVCQEIGARLALLIGSAARDGLPLYEAGAGELARFASLAQRRYADTRKFREMEREEIRDYVSRGGR